MCLIYKRSTYVVDLLLVAMVISWWSPTPLWGTIASFPLLTFDLHKSKDESTSTYYSVMLIIGTFFVVMGDDLAGATFSFLGS